MNLLNFAVIDPTELERLRGLKKEIGQKRSHAQKLWAIREFLRALGIPQALVTSTFRAETLIEMHFEAYSRFQVLRRKGLKAGQVVICFGRKAVLCDFNQWGQARVKFTDGQLPHSRGNIHPMNIHRGE